MKKAWRNLIHNNLMILTIIILVGTYLRLVGILDQSYWLDELYSADFSNPARSFSSMLLVTLNDVHPPLYQSLLWILYKIFGYNELVGKGFSAIAGILSIAAIYNLGKVLFNKEIGLISSFLLAINYFAIYYSLETRSYAMLMLLSIVSYTYFIKVLQTPTKYNVLLYWLTTICLFYTHYFGFFLVATQAVVFLLYIIIAKDERKQLVKLAIYTSVVLIISLVPIIPFIIKNSGFNAWWLGTPSPYFFIQYIFSYFHFSLITLLLGICAFISMWYLSKGKISKNDKIGLIILLIWIVIGYLLPYLRSVLSAPLITNRNTIIVLPAILIFITYAIWHFPKILRLGFLLLIFLLSVYTIYPYYSTPIKGQYREVLTAIKSESNMNIYNAIPYGAKIGTNHYQTYADILGLDLLIHTRKELENELNNRKLSDCFLVLDAQGDHVTDLNITTENIYSKVNDVQFHGANVILFSSKNDIDSCRNKVGLKKKE